MPHIVPADALVSCRRCLAVRGLPAVGLLMLMSAVAAPLARQASAADATPDSAAADAAGPVPQRAELLDELGVVSWHAAGFRGRGIKVAILDTGFRGYQAHLGKALPTHVSVRSFRPDGNLEARDSQHGILCAEVIHAVAPDAELLLANWEADQPGQFLDAVRWAHAQGARLISCSVVMPSWSDGEGHGPVHRELARLVGRGTSAGDLLCFASAGNTAQRHWFGQYHPGGNGWHEWTPNQTDNVIVPWSGGDPVSVELYGGSRADFTVCVLDGETGKEMGRGSFRSADECGCAVVRFDPEPEHRYVVRVKAAVERPGAFHVVALGGSLRYSTVSGSIPFPGDGPEVVAVGAVDHEGHRTAYSSCGLNSSQRKPDLVAPVPFPSAWRARPFSGTSAAAPQAAALAALVWSRSPGWTAGQVRETLAHWARDLGPVGHDEETGYGLIQLH